MAVTNADITNADTPIADWDWANLDDRALIIARLNWLQRVLGSVNPDNWDGTETQAFYMKSVFETIGGLAAQAGFPGLLGIGCARIALALPAGLVAKVAYNLNVIVDGREQNRTEWALWHALSADDREVLCPLVGITREAVIVQRRCHSLVRRTDETSGFTTSGPLEHDYGGAVKEAMSKLDALGVMRLESNCGTYDGRVVAHDFGAITGTTMLEIGPALRALPGRLRHLPNDQLLETGVAPAAAEA
jgi:hypothetical protein